MVSVKFVNYSAFSYVQYISYQVKTLTMMCVAGSIDGVHINRITARIVAEGYNEVDLRALLTNCVIGDLYIIPLMRICFKVQRRVTLVS